MIIDITLFIIRFIFELSFHRFQIIFSFNQNALGIEYNFRGLYLSTITGKYHYKVFYIFKRK